MSHHGVGATKVSTVSRGPLARGTGRNGSGAASIADSDTGQLLGVWDLMVRRGAVSAGPIEPLDEYLARRRPRPTTGLCTACGKPAVTVVGGRPRCALHAGRP